MRKRIVRCSALFLLASLLLAVPALADLSLDRGQLEISAPYTLGDLAAARFAVYGLLPDVYRTPQKDTAKPLSRLDAVQLLRDAFGFDSEDMMNIPFRDVDEDHREAVSWAYSNGIAKGRTATEFGTYPVTEQAFVTMLLNALGFQRQFSYGEASAFGESVGLSRPLGISDTFSLGDAALYLQQVLRMTAANGKSMRLRMTLPADTEDARAQTAFPAVVALYPVSLADAEAQMDLATHYLPDRIEVYSGAISVRDVKTLYEKFSAEEKNGGVWYVNRILEDYVYADFQELSARYEPSGEETDFYDGGVLMLRFFYNPAWELACDADDAFSYFADEELSRAANAFYQKYLDRARSPRDAVDKAKRAIVHRARYAGTKGVRDGAVYYADEAHSIVGFFKDGTIVCDGYANVFQYLMHRAGVPCVVCYGSTVSREDAEEGIKDHAWNKVQIGGKWLNMDICWADTGWPVAFDLKDNEFYAQFRHWLITHRMLV